MKAILTGTIAPLGKAYVITLDAQNTASGDDIANEEATAPDKEHVLDALNQVSTGMRAKLGESLSSIKRLNAPFGQATTPSLEAFRAYAPVGLVVGTVWFARPTIDANLQELLHNGPSVPYSPVPVQLLNRLHDETEKTGPVIVVRPAR